MKREVTRTRTRSVKRTITICDKCGLEAENPKSLYKEAEREVFHNIGEEKMKFALRHARTATSDHYYHAFEVDVEPGRAVIEWLRESDPAVELCSDCYADVLDWGED